MPKRRNAKEMERLLARRDRHGWTWDRLSEETGVPKSTLGWWHRHLRGSRRERSRPQFVEVEVTSKPSPGSTGAVEIVLRNGRRVTVQPGFDVEHLRRVIEVVESGC